MPLFSLLFIYYYSLNASVAALLAAPYPTPSPTNSPFLYQLDVRAANETAGVGKHAVKKPANAPRAMRVIVNWARVANPGTKMIRWSANLQSFSTTAKLFTRVLCCLKVCAMSVHCVTRMSE